MAKYGLLTQIHICILPIYKWASVPNANMHGLCKVHKSNYFQYWLNFVFLYRNFPPLFSFDIVYT